jgi:3-deoxy-D-manno-octulosonate 8-phosphate phosphatase (KDO 8-P phosphatase)
LVDELSLEDDEVSYIGDDWMDIPLLKRVGLSVAVSNAAFPVSDYTHYVTTRPGGSGAVREVCDLILKAQDKWSEFLNTYLGS